MKRSFHRNGSERIRDLFYALVSIYFSGIFIGILTYGEPFRFIEYPVSDLGATMTSSGFSNVYANLVFAATVIARGVMLVIIGVAAGSCGDVQAGTLKCALGMTGGIHGIPNRDHRRPLWEGQKRPGVHPFPLSDIRG